VNAGTHKADKLGEISSANSDFAWSKPGASLIFSRNVNGLANLWEYTLTTRTLTQITSGPGPNLAPMADPSGRSIYFVNGKASGFLSVYRVHSKQSVHIVAENASQPTISTDGKRVMYVTMPEMNRSELWTSDIDGSNKIKLASSENTETLEWSGDSSKLAFADLSGGRAKLFVVGADGANLHPVPLPGTNLAAIFAGYWAPDGKFLYISGFEKDITGVSTWKASTDGSKVELLEKGCGLVGDVSPDGNYLIYSVYGGSRTGMYEMSLLGRKCNPLLPGVAPYVVHFTCDGQSLLYAVSSRGEVTIHRQPWKDGKLTGADQAVLKIPFAFPQDYNGGNAYDFSRDLSTVVYARPSGQVDLYLPA
jgi:Tol biopolymer transport system component